MRTKYGRGATTVDRGFTLVEILIVVVILGVLATVVVFAVRGMTDRGEAASCDEDRRVLSAAAESYFAQFADTSIRTSDPAVAGVTGATPEATLTQVGLLVSPSDLHDVDADGAVTVPAGSRC